MGSSSVSNSTPPLTRIRSQSGLHWNEGNEQILGWWNVTRYEDVLFISRHPELFSSERGIVQYAPVNEEDQIAAGTGNGKMLIN